MSENESSALSPFLAAALPVVTVTVAAKLGERWSPTPDQPRIKSWYDRLKKPGFTPPAPVYGIAWTAIEAALTFSAYRLLRKPASPARSAALSLWGANQVAIAGWSPIFFGLRSPGWGTAAAATMIGTSAGYTAVTAKIDRPAATASIPLIAWVSFATLLSFEIWRRNDPVPR